MRRQGIRGEYPRGGSRPEQVRCRVCLASINLAAALAWMDRKVFCLTCLAQQPQATAGERLLALRLAAGIKQSHLARQCGLSSSLLYLYEVGAVRPGPANLRKLAAALGADLEQGIDALAMVRAARLTVTSEIGLLGPKERAQRAGIHVSTQQRLDTIARRRPDLLELIRQGRLTTRAAARQMEHDSSSASA